MLNQVNLRARVSLITVVLDYIHSRDWKDHEGFAALLVERLLNASPSDEKALVMVLVGMKHPFFIFNSTNNSDFIRGFPVRRSLSILRSPAALTGELVSRLSRHAPSLASRAKRIYLEDLDSFARMRGITRSAATKLVPLDIPERKVKELLCKVLGVAPIPEDWGGERSDLVADVGYRGKTITAAFMLKGKGTRGRLTISRCGKNGDQVIRLIEEPARLFVIQHVDAIDSNVTKLLKIAVGSIAKTEQLYYCVADGVETARLFEAYARG